MTTGKPAAPLYQIKVTLREVRPPVWRRFQVPGGVDLAWLHEILRVVMGWDNYHPWEFETPGGHFGIPDPEFGAEVRSAARMRLDRVAPAARARLRYLYDFGDGWEHDLLVEKVLPPGAGSTPPVCTGGARACPPEDCGGPWGYEELLEAIRDPANKEHDSMLEWLGGSFDPEAFDPERINAVLRAM